MSDGWSDPNDLTSNYLSVDQVFAVFGRMILDGDDSTENLVLKIAKGIDYASVETLEEVVQKMIHTAQESDMIQINEEEARTQLAGEQDSSEVTLTSDLNSLLSMMMTSIALGAACQKEFDRHRKD